MPPPNAASLGKYGDIPVSNYTGVPSVGIPVYTVTDGPVSLPVSLSYHAGGMKVGELASWAGLGWSLQAGGIISRTVQGKEDERENGYFQTGSNLTVDANGCLASLPTYSYSNFRDGAADGEPDIFSFSVGGYNGKFFFEADKTSDGIVNPQIVLVPKQDVRITYELDGSISNIARLKSFTITTPDGIRYQFGTIIGDPAGKCIELTRTNPINSMIASSWYLRKISSADGIYSILLDYVAEKYQYGFRASFGSGYQSTGAPNAYMENLNYVEGWRLSSITSQTTTLTFVADVNREDIDNRDFAGNASASPAKRLSKIQIASGNFCKSFELSHAYYVDNSALKTGKDNHDKRLKLNTVQEKSCDGTVTANPYTMQYFEDSATPSFLPNRLSSAMDHWGFYNGASANTQSGLNIPATRLQFQNSLGENMDVVKGGSNRQTSQEPMKMGTLKKISYPTGGSTTLELEANTVYAARTTATYTQVPGTLSMAWPSGPLCSDGPYIQYASMTQTLDASLTYHYKWESIRTANGGSPACASSGASQIKVFNNATNASLGSAVISPNYTLSTKEGALGDLIAGLPNGVVLRFEIWGRNSAAKFTLFSYTETTTNNNFPVGGLRVKQITSHDGVSTANDVVKTYTYNNALVNPDRSSAILYNDPKYGHVFRACLNASSCRVSEEPTAPCPSGSILFVYDFFFENSVVPLSSFEGYHMGYSAVKEYFNGSSSGYYNHYEYINEPSPGFTGLPIKPIQPRVTSGQLSLKRQRNASGLDITYDQYTQRTPEITQNGQGTYVKFNTYFRGGDPSSPISGIWKSYPITTRPFRYQKVDTYLDGQLTTVDKLYNGTNHLQLTKETLSNSDGKVTETEYKYPADLTGLPAAQLTVFNALNLLVPLEITVKVSGTTVNGSKTEYGFFDNASGNFLGTTVSATTSFIRPYQFKNYEGAAWVQKGQIDSYHGTSTTTGRAGLPRQFAKTGWLAETYEWTSAGLIKQRKFKDFLWKYEYLSGTSMVSKITKPDGQFTEYMYDKLMRLDEAKARASNVKTKYTYTFPVVNASGVITSFGNVKSANTFTATAGSGLATQETFHYFDGLGRGIETVFKGKTPSGTDQVVATSYDNQGRVSKSFEPFAGTANTGAYQSPGANAHTLTEYDPNPLNRIWKVTSPAWAATINTYAANTSGDAVLNFNFSTGSSATLGADLLTKTTTTDGNGNKSITFTDKKGRMLLSRKTNGAESSRSDTYYVYDDKDRLVRVLPPGASWSDAELVFTYQYTNSDLISQKKVPGKAYEAYEYNSRDLPVRYQDPILRANSNRWMGSKYDDYGRLTQKGVYASGTGDGISLSNNILENIYSTATTGIETDKLKTSKVQAFTVADPVVTPAAANAVLQTTFNYDTYGRVSSTTGNNHTNITSTSAESVAYGYDHGDNILTETRSSVHSGGTTSIANTRLFDAWGRLTQTSQSINGASATVISRLAYTAKDQLANKKLGPGTNGLQQIDYAYLTNGLLSSINSTAGLSGSTFPVSNMLTNFSTPTFAATNDDLFRQTLEYNTLTGGLSGTAQNSGNIGQMIWQVKGRAAQAYGFTYDYLDRLTSSKYSSYTSAGGIDAVDYYGEAQTFDVRGNITSITRKGMVKGGSNYTNATIDSQTLTIPTGGNLSTQSTGVNSIPPTHVNLDAPHNHLNLPNKFDFGSNNVIELLYDGLGNKLRKTVKTAGTVTLTQNYLDGIELKNNVVEAVYNEEGRAFNNAGTFRYEYVLRDHLGNSRVVFSDKNNSESIDNTEILSENHYYPFGKSFDGAWYNDATAGKYRYLYNGKELNEEFSLNLYDYGARWLDPGVGSWWEVDPMSEKYPSMTPYSYVFNNPLKYIDPDGRDGVLAIKGNTLTISSNIYVYGSGATKATASLMQRDIMAKWDKGFSVKDAAGNSYNVKFDVKVGVYGGKEKADPFIIPESWNPNNRDNFVEVGATLGEVGRSFVSGGDEGEWRGVGRNGMNLSQDNPAAHEFGHMLGLDDRYDDKKGPHPGWGNNIMGDSQKGNADQRNINSIVGDAMKAYDTWSKDKNNAGKTFRYEINVDKPDKERQ
ncbi:RHS repeat-associated core domain-containing protein [Dyadobacter sp. CY345]|uniref:RHS repeat domain-containing protein n=1 Tax=Dyadobacter sp. CY345 TaxID=2909335 RepID=UPI001F2E1FBD|nr:RHS repeat-associated core domain-containing protein [Dyadobacter sp. CY345]MCF2446941.1 RHS repeat-associated core domain-containing protein [Dyadobacter sp. CY345]